MDKREKVIKGLECCDGYCDDETGCPYFDELEPFDCQEQLRADAIALLKAQETPTVRECKDLQMLRNIKSGKLLKSGCKDYVIFNGDWYRSHRYEWPMEPRVMTLEEIVENSELRVVWVERRNGDICAGIYEKCRNTAGGVCAIFFNFRRVPNNGMFSTSSYNVSWRCWTSRPTDEQRAATPWEAVTS